MIRKAACISFGVVLLVLGTMHPAWAQATKYAQSGMTFLKIDPAADVAALGGTYMSTSGKATSIFSNPAGLALLEGGDVTAGITNWIADIRMYSLAAAHRVGNLGVFGVSVISMDYGTFRGTRPWRPGDPPELRNQGFISLGDFGVSEYAVGIAYARRITNQFSVGG